MKKILSLLSCLSIMLYAYPFPVQAVDTKQPSLADAVYADLALKGYLDNASITFVDENPHNTITINQDKAWIPASTVKLFVAMYAFKQINEGKLSLKQTVTADWKNIVTTELVTSELPTIQEGDLLTIDRLLRQMITQSDNTAYNILLDVLDRTNITEYMHTLGLTHTAIGSKLNLDDTQQPYEYDTPGYGINTTTAADYTQAFKLILKKRIAGANPLLEILKQQKINNMIPLLLPSNTIIAHKTGDWDPLFHDGGIIFAPGDTYIVSIFTNAGDPNLVAHISNLVYSKNFTLVGQSISPKTPPNQSQPLDALVAQGEKLPVPNVLGMKTKATITQPITAADLGITAGDLSLVQSPVTLPHVYIPADSPFHVLTTIWGKLQQQTALMPQQKSQRIIHNLLLQIAEAKDLESRGKTQQAAALLQNIQPEITKQAQSPLLAQDATSQINLQAISETRFDILQTALKNATNKNRNELISEIGEQAKSTLTTVLPNVPLAINATNPTQHPLIGQVISKTDAAILVKTAGGQQVSIPLNDTPLIKTKNIINPLPSPQVSQIPTSVPSTSTIPTIVPTQPTHVSLASLAVGTTVAMVGSTNNNTFTPTFVLTNVPKELVAPEPVTVIKVNKKNKTMVINENSVPVQVNVTDQTIIKGSNTAISFSSIKPGDIVVVHGTPLTPVTPSPTPAPTHLPVNKTITTPTSASSKAASQTASHQQPTITLPTSINLPTQAASPNSQLHPTAPTTNQDKQEYLPQTTTHTQVPTNTGIKAPVQQETTSPQQQPTVKPQPKVIQSTSIQVIEKAQDTKQQNAQPQSTTNTTPQHTQTDKSQTPQKEVQKQGVPDQKSQPKSKNDSDTEKK